MIDISQIVSSAANAVEGARRASADATASGFGDALSRARESSKAPAPPAREAAARDQPASRQPAAQADAGKPQPAAAAGKKPAAGHKDEDQDQDDTAAATPTDAAAAAAAALALMLPAAAPASPAAAPAGAEGSAIAGVADTGAAALQAALANAAQPATADAQADAMPAAATPLPETLQVVTTEARPAQPSVADTLATIASQRAAMQASTSAGTDGKTGTAQAIPGDVLAVQQDASGQSAGGSGNRPDSGIARHRADPLAASPGTADARPAATPFAVAQAAARTGEAGAASPDNTQAVAAALAGQATPSATAAAAAASARPVVTPQLYDSQWPQALGQQMIRMSTQGQQRAELQLNPPDLGPLKVVLNVVNDQAQAQFVSPHQAVRAAVEAALPHLRTALSENGIQLGQTSVGADAFASQAGNGNGQQQQAPGNGRGQTGFGSGTLAAVEPAAGASTTVRPARGLGRGEIDTFA